MWMDNCLPYEQVPKLKLTKRRTNWSILNLRNNIKATMTIQEDVKGYCIESVISELSQQSENLQLSLMHRFIYNHTNIRLLTAIHKKITHKLVHLSVLPSEYATTSYDQNAVKVSMEKLHNRN